MRAKPTKPDILALAREATDSQFVQGVSGYYKERGYITERQLQAVLATLNCGLQLEQITEDHPDSHFAEGVQDFFKRTGFITARQREAVLDIREDRSETQRERNLREQGFNVDIFGMVESNYPERFQEVPNFGIIDDDYDDFEQW